MQCQGQRGILELRFPHAGQLMFHAHQSEFTELGWQGFFEVGELMEARGADRRRVRGPRARAPAWLLGLVPLLLIAAAIGAVRRARRARPRRAPRPAGRGARRRAHGARARRRSS